ncbi:MAG: hypothetical protein ACI865_002943 [Flavobacteriaceae bacterium]|jgi:hypothetical protein
MKKITLFALFTGVSLFSSAQFWKVTEPQKVGGTINNLESEESIPIFSKDSSLLYFVRTFDKNNRGGFEDQDVWSSAKDSLGNYSDCKLVKTFNNKYNNAVVGMSRSGDAIYLINAYEGKKDTVKGIAVSRKNGNGWSSPEALNIPGLIIGGTFYGFYMSPSEDVLVISYNGPNSKGEEDLYVSLKENGNWTAPLHMGSAINSAGFEISPFLVPSLDTLYFSSNGYGGEGNADIFYSVKKGSWSDWSAPKNLGNSVNSSKFDAYFSFSGDQAYWSSNRDGERSDIYSALILSPPPLEASAIGTDVSVYRGTDGSIDLTVTGGVGPFAYTWSNGTSSEDPIGLVKGDYTVRVTDAVGQIADVPVTINEPPLEIEPVIISDYDNLDFQHFFGYNRNKLKMSRGDLKKFIKTIESQIKDGREKITIKVVSSASTVPTKAYASNDELAKLRGNNLKYDLVAHFDGKDKWRGKVTVVVVSSSVQGPEYGEDAENRSKYEPFQFVKLTTE